MRHSLVFLMALLLLPSCPQEQAAEKTESKVAITVNGVPIEGAEIRRLALLITSYYHNLSFEFAQSAVLTNSLVPRAVAVSRFQDQVEPLKKKLVEARKKILAGEPWSKVREEATGFPTPEDNPPMEYASIKSNDYLVTEWLFNMDKEEISEPILTKYGWQLVKVLEKQDPLHPLGLRVGFEGIILPFSLEPNYQYLLRQWTEEAVIQVVDPEFNKILPEWMKYTPGNRKYREMNLPETGKKPKKGN